MSTPDDEHERLNEDERAKLERELAEVGPWVYLSGTGGVHRAERAGTQRFEQAATSAHGLLAAVRRREFELEQLPTHVVSIVGGVQSHNPDAGSAKGKEE